MSRNHQAEDSDQGKSGDQDSTFGKERAFHRLSFESHPQNQSLDAGNDGSPVFQLIQRTSPATFFEEKGAIRSQAVLRFSLRRHAGM